MAKKDLEIVLITSEDTIKNNISGIVLGNTIKYNDDGVIVVLDINDNNICMRRTTDEYQLVLYFSKNQHKKGSYTLKENNMKLDISIYTKELIIDNNSIKIVYTFNDEIKEFSLLIKE